MITNAQIEHNLGKAYYLRTANPRNLTAPVSKSLLWDFNESPYKWRHSSGREVTKAMDLGTLIHSAILEPETALTDIAAVSPFPDFRTKAAQEWRDDQREMGRMIATDADIRTASSRPENHGTNRELAGNHEHDHYPWIPLASRALP
jgi:hypothetical protein